LFAKKILGLNDKEAALAADYSLSVAESTKAKIWGKRQVRIEFERLKARFGGVLIPANSAP
jgi:hypothetical protein